jgi:hypothetical protein
VVDLIERRLRRRGHGAPPDAFLLGNRRSSLVEVLQHRLLESIAAVHWPTFYRLAPVLCAKGLDGLRAAVGLSLPAAQKSGLAGELIDTLDCGSVPRPQSVAFGRLTRATAGHVIFRTQLLALAEEEFATTPLEMSSLLVRHTATAIRAMLQARLIRHRPALESGARQTLVLRATCHLQRLLPERDTAECTLLLLRLAYYRLHHPMMAREVLRRVRIVDFTTRHAAGAGRRAGGS